MGKEKEIEEKDVTTIDEVVQEPSLKGRARSHAAYREANPDAGEELDDDAVHDWMHEQKSASEKAFSDLNEANVKFAELLHADPKFGEVITMTMDGKSFPYAMGKVYGKDWRDLEGDDLEDFERGYQENLKALGASKELQKKALENVQNTYIPTMDKFQQDNGLSDEEMGLLEDKINEVVGNALNGIITGEFIDFINKGITHDRDVEDAIATGKAGALNEKIVAQRGKKFEGLPDTAPASAAELPSKSKKRSDDDDYDIYRTAKPVAGTGRPASNIKMGY
ncbi:MAG: hypothetical protein LBC68_05235 [Prevotellaceae bacterium]|jgi:hypothetical protein|nr:hypothetical protein [Prevotellaceae bacterium]